MADGSSGATVKVKETLGLDKLVKPIPKGRLGDLEIGRIICGGNLISGLKRRSRSTEL